ncbi:MAG: glycine--tRNA ligase subunit beta [Gammaproteobacteria bacterium]|nr:glycine--tRNA ligase subunit beta [Gammaproteobacteria bacterium]
MNAHDSQRADFLVEIGTEELPPKALKTLSQRFTAEISQRLAQAGLTAGEVEGFASPRRLATLVHGLMLNQPSQGLERKGPALSAAFGKDGQPTPAALGFARSCNVEFSALERMATDKGEWLVYRAIQVGRPTRELLPGLVEAALAALPIPKRMRWGAGTEEFVRPVHWVVMLLGHEVVDAEILGIQSGRETRGHRFMGEGRLALERAADYAPRLEQEGRVVADFARRRDRVATLVREAAQAQGCQAILNEELLDEVTALVEWPVPVVGTFEPHFLTVPREALIATMQGNQKYFPLQSTEGALQNRFITIANIESPVPDMIRDGNERVIRPRLSDASFFYDKDRKTPLAARCAQLASIVFERRLGSLKDKSDRVMHLAMDMAPAFGADPAEAARVAQLSRCDLVTEMVGEFPELQGTMGRYYALHDGEPAGVAEAIGQFYQPRFAGDAIPASPLGRAVACADRLDTLVGIFSVGGAPTGDRDPYALRRAALGVLRLCIEGDASLDLQQALSVAAATVGGDAVAQVTPVFEFALERARGYFLERGYRQDVIESVLSTRPTAPRDLARRIAAVAEFTALPQATALAAANKRIANILRKNDMPLEGADFSALCEGEELALAAAVTDISAAGTDLLARGDYTAWLTALAGLHDPVNRFFDAVLVMAEEPGLRLARLALLKRIHGMFLRVADVALISG